MEFQNKVALVTGGTQGIGEKTAILLAEKGADIALVSRYDNEKLRNTIASMGVRSVFIAADLSKEEECLRAVRLTIEQLGKIDILIHSAGSAAPGSLLEGARDTWYAAFDIHIHAIFHLCRAAVPQMKERKTGAIVLISSAAGLRGVKNALPYAVVKGAIPQFTRALAFELSDFNIRVNCVSPGVIRTRFQDYLTPEQVARNINERIPLHKEGTAENVASAICSLIDNGFITGENLVIDGGMTMRIA
ncbi:MAG: SDR family oxidoreductase [Chitinophagaceae bacterium]|nr:SDR family oxidoreductase [Chitinophagaceae bacterium]MCW5926034.1 SDR family oxidoreductase [Chitinophagaceae bacterium]